MVRKERLHVHTYCTCTYLHVMDAGLEPCSLMDYVLHTRGREGGVE